MSKLRFGLEYRTDGTGKVYLDCLIDGEVKATLNASAYEFKPGQLPETATLMDAYTNSVAFWLTLGSVGVLFETCLIPLEIQMQRMAFHQNN